MTRCMNCYQNHDPEDLEQCVRNLIITKDAAVKAMVRMHKLIYFKLEEVLKDFSFLKP